MAGLGQKQLKRAERSHTPATDEPWGLARLCGRMVEISGRGSAACLSAAFDLVLQAQQRGEWVAWIALRGSTFFPPDVDDAGVDLETLLVVRCADAPAAARAADQLVRSGGLGLVVLDLHAKARPTPIPQALLTRLLGLVQKHQAALVFLSEKPATLPSVSPLVSLRAEAQRRFKDGGWEVRLEVVKDKRFRPGGIHNEARRGPDGLR